jgi:MFS transporter, DHA2 family, multidrug resistance protein
MAAPGPPVTSDRPVQNRGIITLCCMVGTLMQALDATIANVALPYMQGSLSATYDQITWVLTSYIIAAAIMTAPVGWLAARFGRRNLFVVSLAGFTVTSMLCGAAQSLDQIVVFRVAQGCFGAALVPLSQSIMLDIYPAEKRGQAMAIWGMGVMVGPIMGPTLGGYLTEFYSWRYVFYVNVPFGIVAMLGLMFFMHRLRGNMSLRFDWLGFAVLALGIGALQMMLDRGELKDWFSSREIIVEGVLALLGFYLFLVHLFTAKKPFIPPAIFRDINFTASMLVMFSAGLVLVASSALLAPYLQDLANYPVQTAGLVLAPRGVGTLAAMMVAGRLADRMDPRILMLLGVALLEYSLWLMLGWTPDIAPRAVAWVIVIQGAGLGLVFTPLQVMAFATLPVAFRTDGTSLLSLFRNFGSAIGVSVTSTVLDRVTQIEHAALTTYITPFQRLFQNSPPIHRFLDPGTPAGAALLNQVIDHQAQVIAYLADFKLMILTTLPIVPLLLVMRRHAAAPGLSAEHAAVME